MTDIKTLPPELREKLDQVRNLHRVTVEVVGSWIWVGGDTKPHKEKLKEWGFYWSGRRKKWYWKPPESGNYYPSNKSYSQIKQKYGAKKVKDTEEEES